PLRFLATVQHGEPLRPHEMGRIDAAQLAVELCKDHIQVNGGPLVGHHHDDHVPHAAMLEHQVAQVVEGGGAGALAEAEQQEVGTQRMHIAAFQRVVVALLLGAVVQNAGVLETGVIAEQRHDEQLLGPAHPIAHRAAHRLLTDHDAHVARPRRGPWAESNALHRFANAKLRVSSSNAMFTDFTATSPGTASCTGAKLRMAFTPARTSRSTTSCADSAGVTTMAMSLGSLARSASRWRMSRTTRPFQREPIFLGSLS